MDEEEEKEYDIEDCIANSHNIDFLINIKMR